jgi:hypothetical protein
MHLQRQTPGILGGYAGKNDRAQSRLRFDQQQLTQDPVDKARADGGTDITHCGVEVLTIHHAMNSVRVCAA